MTTPSPRHDVGGTGTDPLARCSQNDREAVPVDGSDRDGLMSPAGSRSLRYRHPGDERRLKAGTRSTPADGESFSSGTPAVPHREATTADNRSNRRRF